ncbi:MAG: TIGR02206 family membrane protein [Clostridiales bacterium]|nr:TIGR02206 family membrane protein [Clostridiales bacterium]
MDNFVYEYHSEGFFGYSKTPIFEYFSLAHLLPILLLIVGIFLTYRYKDKLRGWKYEDTFRTLIGVWLIFNECSYYWRLLYVGNSMDGTQMMTFLPLQVCEWTAYIAAFMLIKKNRHMFDIAFYIALTLGLIPLITPAVITKLGFGHYRYYSFWIEHIFPILGVFYMMFVHGFRPDFRKVYKPLTALSILACLAIYANLNIPDANYMYLAAGTPGDSLANVLPSNVWARLVVALGIICVLFTIVSLPQIIKEIKQKRSGSTL